MADVRVTLNNPLPSSGSSAIDRVEYRLNGGTAVDSGLIAFTPLPLTFVIPEADTANIEIRQKNATLYSNWSGIKNAFELVLTGLDNGKAVIGTEPTISFVWSPTEGAPTLIEQYWSLNNLANGAEETFGFDVNPSSLAGADNQPLWLIAQDSAGAYYEVGTTVKQPLPVAANNLPDQVLVSDTGIFYIEGSLYLTGGGITYSVPGAPSGVTVDPVSGQIRIDTTGIGVVTGAVITLSGTNSGGGPITTAGSLDVTANIAIGAITTPVASTLWDEDLMSDLTNLATFEDPANYTPNGDVSVVSIFKSGSPLSLTNQDELLLEGEAWEITFRVTKISDGAVRDYVISGTTAKLWSLTDIGTNKISVDVEAGVPGTKVMPKVNGCEHGKTADAFRNNPVLVCGVDIAGATPVGSTLTRTVTAVTVPDGRTLDPLEDQWLRGGAPIAANANAFEYTTVVADAGEFVRDEVTARDSTNATGTEQSGTILVDGAVGYAPQVFVSNGTAWLDGMAHADDETRLAGAMWLRLPSLPSATRYVWSIGSNTISYLSISSAGVVDFRLKDNVGSGVTQFRSQSTPLAPQTLYLLYWEFDAVAVTGELRIDNVIQSVTVGPLAGDGTVRNSNMNFLANGAETIFLNVEFFDFMMAYGAAADAINPDTLWNTDGTPIDPGTIGTGSLVYNGGTMTVADINAGANLGTGGVWPAGSGTFT